VDELLTRFALAFGIGLVIGLERGWRAREAEPGHRAAGIRTFAISGLLGGVIGAMARWAGEGAGGGLILAIGFAAYAVAISVFCRDENRAAGFFSATTAVAAMVTFALGAYVLVGDQRLAVGAAVVTAGALAAREQLHGLVAKSTWAELRSVLVLLAMTFVVLPFLPARPVGPFGGVDLREVWLIAIVLGFVQFLGYAAIKYFGTSRGLLLAAAAGGLASSTSVTIANARRAATAEGPVHVLAAGVAIATAISFVRVITIIAALNPGLLRTIAPALAAATAVAVAFAAITFWRTSGSDDGPAGGELHNPFSFWPVVGFAILLGAVIVLGRALGQTLGAAGALIGAVVVGLADVDSVTVSLAQLAPDPLSPRDAALAVLAAVASNTASKVGIGMALGRGRFAAEIAGMALACALAGGAVLWAFLAFGAA
jgi:uncharacterized membrane protein (DUF4010 family)